jgi:hypothetical protein
LTGMNSAEADALVVALTRRVDSQWVMPAFSVSCADLIIVMCCL